MLQECSRIAAKLSGCHSTASEKNINGSADIGLSKSPAAFYFVNFITL